MADDSVNLFVYGSLRDASIFRSVCGMSFSLKAKRTGPATLRAELAFLPGYRKVSPDNVYFYAIEKSGAKIEGFVIHDVPAHAMAEIDKYEGRLYGREMVMVNTAGGGVYATAYLASDQLMQTRFGDRFHVNLIHELWLRKRIEGFFKKYTRPGERSHDADVERRAMRELLGTTERDLMVSHLGSVAVSDYFLEREFDRPIPSIKSLYEDPQAEPFMENYITFTVKQVLLNQFELKIQSRFRYDLDQIGPSRRYFTRSISLLVALRMINTNRKAVDLVLQKCLETMPVEAKYDLIDYVKYAVSAADSIFDSRVARSEITHIGANRHGGIMPLGAELEFSNVGFLAIEKGDTGADDIFDGFKYFHDFRLDVLSWKLGGYIDDHSGANDEPRRRGFLEIAPGRLNILGDISKPATNDPWVMNQLIREITRFYPVKPHSLHLSFQMRKKQIGNQKMMPLSFIKCLLVLGGGMERTRTGKLWASRMAHNEIQQYQYGEELVFTRMSKRKYHIAGDYVAERLVQTVPYVNQYKFIRLDGRANYEPLIMALKGLQIAYNPADYLTVAQLAGSRRLQKQYEQLKEWSQSPTEITRQSRKRFLDMVQKGLMTEAHQQPAHKLHYVDWAMSAIDVQLRLFNMQVKSPSGSPSAGFPTPTA